MSGLKSIALAIDVALQKRDLACQKLVQAQRTIQHEQNQLDQLENYATDSQARWSASAHVAHSAELLKHHYQFMDRLHQAIAMQTNVLSDLRRALEAIRRLAIDAEMRVASLKKLSDRKNVELRRTLDKREQKQTDELATMKFARAAVRLH